MNNYKILGRIGQGAHGYVLKALNEKNETVVALKKICFKNLDEGIPKNVMREITALTVLNSKHVFCRFDFSSFRNLRVLGGGTVGGDSARNGYGVGDGIFTFEFV